MEKTSNSEITLANKDKTCLIILGPTGIGKTKISLALGSRLHTEIINTDAFSFYKNAEIMTAKANKEEKQIVKHHLIDFLEIKDLDFSVSNFQSYFDDAVSSIFAKEKIPIIVGGSNYYVDYILFDKRISILNINGLTKEKSENSINERSEETDLKTEKNKDFSVFVNKQSFQSFSLNLKVFIGNKYNKEINENLILNNNIFKSNKNNLKKDIMQNTDTVELTTKVLDKIENEYLKILDKFDQRINRSEFLNTEEVTKTENLLFDALNEILDYKNFSSFISREKDYSFLLHNLLEVIDIHSYNLLHKNNLRKIVNVLMYYFVYGKARSYLLESQLEILHTINNKENDYIRFENTIIVYLKSLNNNTFQKRIKSRIDLMLNEQNGLEEVFIIFEFFLLLDKTQNKTLLNNEEKTAFDFQKGILQAIGYKEFYDFYIEFKNVFLEFIEKNNFSKNNENKVKIDRSFFELLNIDKIQMEYLLEQYENERDGKYSNQIMLIIFVIFFKRKYLYNAPIEEETEKNNLVINQISDYLTSYIGTEKTKLIETFKKCRDLLIKNTLKYAKSQIKYVEKRILPNLNKNFSRENHNLLEYGIEEFTESTYNKIISDIIENIKNKIAEGDKIKSKVIEEFNKIEISKDKEDKGNKKREWKKFTCDICDFVELNGETEFISHLESNKHKKRKRKINRIKQEREILKDSNIDININ